MNYPALIIDRAKLQENTEIFSKRCHDSGISVAAVSKVYCGMAELVQAQVDGGADWIADSRIENLAKMRDIKIPKILLRLPMISQAKEVVELSDLSFVSEVVTCKALSDAAVAAGKVHEVLLMVDVGDLREGVWPDRAVDVAGEILSMANIKLKGVGANLTCYGGVLPSGENLSLLVSVAEEIESRYGVTLEMVSGGNSSSINLIGTDDMPSRVNMLRLGESLTIGYETAKCTRVPGLHGDVFTLAAEIIEIQTKPSVPIGEIGRNAFGEVPVFEDRGMRQRAIVAIGQQDMRPDSIFPKDKAILVLGSSSDHLLLDITDSDSDWKIGDVIEFNLGYGGVLAASTSDYVSKVII